MTPEQHTDRAEELLTAYENPVGGRTYTSEQWLILHTHAVLGRAAGTGGHYDAADAIITSAETAGHVAFLPDLHRAHAHALLADLPA